MKTKSRSSKAHKIRKPKAEKRGKVTGITDHPAAHAPKGGDSDRGLYVRFDSPAVKDAVKKTAQAQNLSMNGYIVAATLHCQREGIALAPPEAEKAAG